MSQTQAAPEPTKAPEPPARAETEQPSRWQVALRDIAGGSVVISILAVVIALVIGAILIAITDPGVQRVSVYFFARPGDTFGAIWSSVSSAYISLFQGSVYNFGRPTFAAGIRPFTETLTFATPLIAGGLGVALAFRVGMFNIGGRGQMLIAAAVAGWVGWSFNLPPVLHLILAVVAGIAGGAIWGGIAGLLKARTGAHEVIVTIMLNRSKGEPFVKGGNLQLGYREKFAEEKIREFDVRAQGVDTKVGRLSGGNQQKVVLARELSRELRLFVAAQPTRGLDVGSIEFVHKRIVATRDEGIPVIVVSTELDEVAALADRIAVMYRGGIVGIVPGGTSRDVLGLMMAGELPADVEVAA